MTPPSDNAPLVSTKRELRNLGANTQATAAELKAFLAELKGRSPQEMLGIVAASRLVRALVFSSILVLALILVFTIVPYLMGDQETTATAEAEVAQPAQTPAPDATPTQAEKPIPANTEASDTPTQPDISPLGVNEEKTAPANVNPLESDNDNFLDGLE